MAPKNLTIGQKKWMSQQLRHVKSLKTEAGKKRFIDDVLEDLEDTKPQTVRQHPVSRPIPEVLLLIFSHLVQCKRHDYQPSSRDLQPERAKIVDVGFE
jgi:hypothetical protein